MALNTGILILLCAAVTVYSTTVPHQLNKCTCYDRGSYYSPISDVDCSMFIQYSHISPPIQMICPGGTKFDVTTCVCNHAYAVTCPDTCPEDDSKMRTEVVVAWVSVLVAYFIHDYYISRRRK